MSDSESIRRKSRSLKVMMVLIGGYFFIELGVGWYINSLALISDALHSLSDMVALVVGLAAVSMAKRGRCATFTYGWHRAEILGGLINGVILLFIVFFIFTEGVHRIIENEEVTDPFFMSITAGIGLLMNLFGLYLFGHQHHNHDCGHSHGKKKDSKKSCDSHHDHCHDHEKTKLCTDDHGHEHCHGHESHDHKHDGHCDHKHDHHHDHKHEEEEDVNIRGVFLHILGDALGSVAVIISGLFIMFTDFKYKHWADPIASMVFAIIIAFASGPLVIKCIKILVQSTPPNIKVDELAKKISALPNVFGVHDFHVWQLSSTKIVSSLHVTMSKQADFEVVSSAIVTLLHRAGIHFTTIQPCFSDVVSSMTVHDQCPDDICKKCDESPKLEAVEIVVN
ncbi:hypothetical protein RCL1_000415 [Eukaryota sp. TZLM3-RCL]